MTFISNLSPWPPLLPAPPYAINWGLKVVTPPAVEPVTNHGGRETPRSTVADAGRRGESVTGSTSAS